MGADPVPGPVMDLDHWCTLLLPQTVCPRSFHCGSKSSPSEEALEKAAASGRCPFPFYALGASWLGRSLEQRDS